MTDNLGETYNISAIRKLLLATFEPTELRRFCQDRLWFRPVLNEFGPMHSLNEMVDRVIHYCQSHLLFPELLTILKEEFARQYSRFEPYVDPVTESPTRHLGQAARWAFALETYRKRVATLYGTTQIFGQPRPMSIDKTFTDVYLLEKPVAFRRFDIRHLERDPGLLRGARRVAGRELVGRPEAHRLFILGKPGAGKTTFLKHLTLEAARRDLDKVPLFVTLKEWVDSGEALLPFMAQQFAKCGFADASPFIRHLLEETDAALVLFDGLDEVSQENNALEQVSVAIQAFAQQYSRAQCLVTCRTAATGFTFEGFSYVEVADFTPEQAQTLVRKWFQDDADVGNIFLEEINKEQNRGLRELARTPLLLAMLCLAFNENQRFPVRRVEIYQDALDALLRKWDTSRSIRRDETYRALSTGRKQQLFARIAAETFERGAYFFSQNEVEAQINEYLTRLPRADVEDHVEMNAGVVLKAIEAQHGILLERAHRIYSFAHLSFQEYYTARYVAGNADKRTLHSLLVHCTDHRWREVIILTASLLDRATFFFASFRHNIDRIIVEDDVLVAFILWAAETAANRDTGYEPAAVRSFYWYLSLDLDLALDRYRYHDPQRAATRDMAREMVFELDVSLDRALGHGIAPDLTLDTDLAHVLSMARMLSSPTNIDLALEQDLDRLDLFDEEWLTLTDACKDEGASSLYSALLHLEVPSADGGSDGYGSFLSEFQRVLLDQRQIGHEWNFTAKQLDSLGTYLQACKLLLECLDMAYVSNRQVIEDSLLLPPGVWQLEGFP